MKVLVTGSSGFVGTNLSHYLSKYTLRFFDRSSYVVNISADTYAIIHLAGKAHDLKKVSKPNEYYEANFELTRKLYDVFLKSNAEKFIFMSSVKAVADEVEGVLTEEQIANPQTHYGKSKHLAEEYILDNLSPEKQVYILRPCMIHGPGNKGNLNLLYRLVSKGIPWPLGTFENKRSFLSIENLCFVIQNLLEKDIPSGIYQVADDTAISTNELIHIIADTLGLKTRIWNINPRLVKGIARLGTNFKLPLNTERLSKLTESYVVSNTKIKEALSIDKMPVDTHSGLETTIQSFSRL